MRALERPYPSFAFVLSQHLYPVHLPTNNIPPLEQSHPTSSQMLDPEDPLMGTVDIRCDGLQPSVRDEIPDALVNLDDAVYANKYGGRLRYLSLSVLVIDLAFAVKHNAERLRRLNPRRQT